MSQQDFMSPPDNLSISIQKPISDENYQNDFIDYIDNQMHLEAANSNLSIEKIKEKIKERMYSNYCPYIIGSTKSRNEIKYMYYKCRIKDCKNFFRLKFVGEKLYETKSHWEHNHPTNKIFIESKFPLITEEIKNSIHK